MGWQSGRGHFARGRGLRLNTTSLVARPLARAWPLAVALRRQRRQRATQTAAPQPLARGAAVVMGSGEQSWGQRHPLEHAMVASCGAAKTALSSCCCGRLALLEARDELVAVGKLHSFGQLQPLLGRLHAVQGSVQGSVHGEGAEVQRRAEEGSGGC